MNKLKLFLQSLSLENGSGIPRENLGNGSVKFLTVFAAFFMLFTLGIGNAWGTDVNGSIALGNAEGAWNATTTSDFTDENDLEWSRTYSSGGKQSIQSGICQFGNSSNACTSLVLSTTIGSQVTLTAFSADFVGGASKTSGTIKLYCGTVELASATISGTASVTCEISSNVSVGASDAIKVEYTGTNGSIKISGISYSYTTSGSGSQQPTVLAKQGTTTYNVSNPLSFTYEGANSQSLTLECSNMTATGSSAALYSDEACSSVVTEGAWVTNISGTASAVTFNVAANTGAARDVYMKITATDGTNNPTTIVKISQGAAPEDPTITFNDGSVEVGETLDVSKLFTSNSEGTVTYSITAGSSYATIDGSTLTGVDVGNVTITASQAAATGYKAKDVTCTVSVTPIMPKSKMIFTAKCNGSGTANDNVAWTVASDASESDFDSNRGVHYGTGKAAVSYLQLTSTAFTNKITKIEVEAAGANSPSISITVGGETFGETATGVTNSNVKYIFQPTQEQSATTFTGAVVVSIEKSESATGALYCKSVVVYYEETPTYAVTFSAPENGTMVIYGEDLDTPITSGDKFEENAELLVSLTPGENYKGGVVKVIKTGVSPEANVTSEVYDNGILTVKDYDITVSATFAAKAVSVVTITNPAHGTITVKDGTETIGENVMEGKELTVSVSGSGYTFTPKAYKTGDESTVVAITNGKLTMQDYAITITADEEKLPCTPLAAPTKDEENFEVTYNSATIAWNAVTDAEGYVLNIIKHSDASVVLADELIEAPVVSFEKTDLEANTQYDYTIMAVGDGTEFCDESNPLLEETFSTSDYPAATLILHDAAGEQAYGNMWKLYDVVPLPETAAACSKKFMGWSANPACVIAPEIAKGANYTLNAITQDLYAVYADGGDEELTITPSDVTGTEDPYTYTIDQTGYTLTANKTNSGSTAPAYNKDAHDVRVYASGTVTLTAPANMTSIVFNISTQGLKRLAPITASVGTIATQGSGDETVTWTGIASSVTFTVGAKANYGTDGESKAGQLCFGTIDVEVEGTPSNYSTTCVAAPVATASPANLNDIAAAGASGTITMSYTNVNTANVTVALFNDAACTEAFAGEWLTASLNNNKNIEYSITENTSYNDARSAYIKLTAPETTDATAPAVVIIPVSQAKKPAVFANLAELAAADVAANTNVTVTLTNEVIKDIYLYNSNRRGLIFNIQKGEADIKIYFNADVPAAWVAGGKVSGTLTDCPWKIYSNAWQLAPANGWQWEWTEEAQKGLVYTEPAEVSTVVVSGNPTKTTYVDGENLNPAGLSVRVNYTDDTYEDNPVGVTFSEVVLHEGNTEANITATFGDVPSETYKITGLTVNPIPNKTIAEFIAAGGTRCYLEGIVSNYSNTTKGYFDLTDASGTLYIYGCTSPSSFAEGDKVKVIAETYEYYQSTTHEAKNVQFVSKVSPVAITITDAGSLSVEKGLTLTISATTEPAAAVANITYNVKAGSDDYASVEGNVVTGKAKGTATIIASVPAGEDYLANSVEFEVDVVEYFSITYEENGGSTVADAAKALALPNPLPETTKENYTFNGWFTTSTFDAETEAVAGTTLTEDVTLYAKWTEIPVWARTYTSNVTLVGGGNSHETNSSVSIAGATYTAKKVGSGDKTGTVSITVPAGTNAVHFHGFAWNDKSVTVSVVASPEVTNLSASSFDLAGDAAGSGSGTYTINSNPVNHYNYFTFDAVEEATTFTFSKTGGSDNRFILYGVNAIYPEITLDPVSFDFGNVRANATKVQVFTITANDNVSGTLSAIITDDDDNNKYSVSAIEDNKVTLTFAPGEAAEGTFTAKLRVEANNAAVTADLTGAAISAAAPMIVTDKSSIAFDRIEPNTEVSASVAVDLQNIDENGVSAALSGDDAAKFSLSATTLTVDGNIVITPNTTEQGIFAATLTLSATDATDVVIPITMTVANVWATTYTSNVTVTAAESKKVSINSVENNAYKKADNANATIMLPKGTQKLHLHMVAWKNEGGNVTISGDCFNESRVIAVAANEVVSGNIGTYTFTEAEAISYYTELTIDNVNTEAATTVTVSKSGSRLILFGVNQEGAIYEVTGNTDASTLPDNATVIVEANANLTVNEDKPFAQVIVEEGATVTLNTDVTTPVFRIETAPGQSATSGQVINASHIVAAEIFMDVTLATAQHIAENAQQWYCISAPFDVNLNGGFFLTDGTPLVHNTHIQVWSFAPDQYANGGRGWKRCTDLMEANKAYLVGFDPDQFGGAANVPNVIRLKAAANTTLTNSVASLPLSQNSGSARDYNWNGVANPNLYYISIGRTGEFYDNETNAFQPFDANSNFVVGAPIFCEANTADDALATNTPASLAPVRTAENSYSFCVRIMKPGARFYDNQLFVTASETAQPTFEQGKDMETLNETCGKSAIFWTNAYGKRLAIENAPLQNNQAIYDLSIMAPAAGTYVLRQANEVNGADLYVTYNGAIVWNLSLGDYEMDLVRGTTTGYGLLLVAQPNQMPTGVENGELLNGENGVQKILLNGNLYILRDGHLYDAVGKQAR